MEVDNSRDKWRIKEFYAAKAIPFETGTGYYEFKKPSEKIQPRKQVVLQHVRSGDMFSGAKAREMIGVDPSGSRGVETVKRKNLPADYRVFVQSTSANRVLVNNSMFLYKVREDDSVAAPA